MMSIECFPGGPLLDQDKAVAVTDYRVQVILNASLFRPDQRRQLLKSSQLVRTSTWLGVDNDDKPDFIEHG